MEYWILIHKTKDLIFHGKGVTPSYKSSTYDLEGFANTVAWENRLMELGIFTETINTEENGI